MTEPLLSVRNLSVEYRTQSGTVYAVDDVSLDIDAGQQLGVIGESGCGKTTLMRALIRVLPRNGRITGGEVFFKGRNLLELTPAEMRNTRWQEIATIPQASMDSLDPVRRVVWWTGHSTGRYGASTWFADRFGLELARNCIAQVNIDSPGCRWANTYTDVTTMTETCDFACQAIDDASGIPATGARPHQAGDYSFNNIGLSAFFMLLSSMSEEHRDELGYYGVGGCGGNIAWHTEDDRLEIADQDVLMRDLRVYAAALQRVLNNPLHPYDFRALAAEFEATLARYGEAAGDDADFGPAQCALAGLQGALAALYGAADSLAGRGVSDAGVRAFNDAQLALARELVPINYTRVGRFRTEPAVPVPELPDLAPALTVGETSGHLRNVTRTHLVRGVNRVAWAFDQAAAIAQRAADTITG